MTKTILNKVGKIAKNSWKYVPIGWTIHDFTRNDLDLSNPWQYFKFGVRNAITVGLLFALPLGIYKYSSNEEVKSLKETHKEIKNMSSDKNYYLNR